MNKVMIFESKEKTAARNDVIYCAERRGDGLFTFHGRGTDYFMAIKRKIAVRSIDYGYGMTQRNRNLIKREMRGLPGAMWISFRRYIKWAKQNNETKGTIFLDLCNPFGGKMKQIITQSVAIMGPTADIFLTVQTQREHDMNGRTREEYNEDRNKWIIKEYKKLGYKATIIGTPRVYRNDKLHSPRMNVIHFSLIRV